MKTLSREDPQVIPLLKHSSVAFLRRGCPVVVDGPMQLGTISSSAVGRHEADIGKRVRFRK